MLTRAYINNIRIIFTDGNFSNRTHVKLAIRNILPVFSAIFGFPNTAACCAEIKCEGLTCHTCYALKLLNILKELLPETSIVVGGPQVTFAADAFFDTGKSAIKPEAKAKLSDLVDKTKGIALEVIIAVGHADSTGGDALNQKLSIARAEAVKKVLVEKGIEKNRVYTEGKGSKAPVADNKTAEGRAKNRRVEVEVVGTRSLKK